VETTPVIDIEVLNTFLAGVAEIFGETRQTSQATERGLKD